MPLPSLPQHLTAPALAPILGYLKNTFAQVNAGGPVQQVNSASHSKSASPPESSPKISGPFHSMTYSKTSKKIFSLYWPPIYFASLQGPLVLGWLLFSGVIFPFAQSHYTAQNPSTLQPACLSQTLRQQAHSPHSVCFMYLLPCGSSHLPAPQDELATFKRLLLTFIFWKIPLKAAPAPFHLFKMHYSARYTPCDPVLELWLLTYFWMLLLAYWFSTVCALPRNSLWSKRDG